MGEMKDEPSAQLRTTLEEARPALEFLIQPAKACAHLLPLPIPASCPCSMSIGLQGTPTLKLRTQKQKGKILLASHSILDF